MIDRTMANTKGNINVMMGSSIVHLILNFMSTF
jgi:hypothetical protein